jgi:putative ATP-binding cassette transporter
MANSSGPKVDRPGPEQGLIAQSLLLYRAFLASPQRNRLFLLGGGLVAVIGMTAYGQIRLNAWTQPFYDALERKDLLAFGVQLGVFALIASGLLILNVTQMWLNLQTKLKLREGLTRDLIGQWMQPKRAFRLANAGEIGANPDQRIHEDARHLTELSTDLALGLLQSSLLLITFIGILWGLSSGVVFHWKGESFTIPGYMVWSAIFYAATASFISWRVGRPLIPLNAQRYAREADLRFALVRANERTDSIAIYGDEGGEAGRLNGELDRVLGAMRRIIAATVRLTTVTAGYGWFTIIAPIVVASPGYFGGDLSFGGLMMAVGAFNQVQQSLRWFVDNFGAIADWRATLLRIASFRYALATMDALHESADHIVMEQAPDDTLTLDRLAVASPSGCIRLSETHVEIGPGQRVVIVGEPGVQMTLVFQALAGLWPWGRGRIALPPRETVAFVPRRPYLPPGPLRAALAYPSSEDSVKDDQMGAALKRVGLNRLAAALDRNSIWEQELTDDEQKLLAFARLSLRKPRCVVIDEALDGLDDGTRKRILTMFNEELAETAVVNIGRSIAQDRFFTELLHLVKDPEGPRVGPRRGAGQEAGRVEPELAGAAE